jgi:hypothetical protein
MDARLVDTGIGVRFDVCCHCCHELLDRLHHQGRFEHLELPGRLE